MTHTPVGQRKYVKYTNIEIVGQSRFEIKQGTYGPRLSLRSPWSPTVLRIIRERQIKELELVHHPEDWNDQEINFLSEIPDILALHIIHFGLENPKPVECLRSLRYLHLATYSDVNVDFSKLTNLEFCSLEWTKGVASALELKNLTTLGVNRLPKAKVRAVSQLTNLRSLHLLSCGAESLDEFRALTKIEDLRLTLFRKLRDNDFLSAFVNLRELWIQDCGGFTSLEPLRGLRKLEKILLENSGPYESLQPLANHDNLRIFVLSGRKSDIVDGDYSPVENLPNLERYFK